MSLDPSFFPSVPKLSAAIDWRARTSRAIEMEDLNQLCCMVRSAAEKLALAKSTSADQDISSADKERARARLRHAVPAIVRYAPRDSAEAALRDQISGYLMNVCHALDEPWIEAILLGDHPGGGAGILGEARSDEPWRALMQAFWDALRAFDPAEVAASRDRSQYARNTLNEAYRALREAKPVNTIELSEKLKAIACVGLARTFQLKAPPWVTPADAIVHREMLGVLVELDADYFMFAFMSDEDAAALNDRSEAAQVLAAGRLIRYAITMAGEAALRCVHADVSRLLATSVH